MANLTISGDTSGSVTLTAPATAGSPVVTLPSASGTMALTSDITGGGLIRNPYLITSGTSYTTPVGCTKITFEMWGGGGGGGCANDNQANQSWPAGSGGGGAYLFAAANVTSNTTYVMTIGAGGAGGTVVGANGADAGNTTLIIGNTTYFAGGGTGGRYTNNQSTPSATGRSLGGIASDGIWNFNGSNATSTNGKGNVFYWGDSYGSTGASGNATWYAVGGGGGDGDSGTEPGGNGFQGMIRIWEYY